MIEQLKSEIANASAEETETANTRMFAEAGIHLAKFELTREGQLLELGAVLDEASYAEWEASRKAFVGGYLKVIEKGITTPKVAKKRAAASWQYMLKRINLIRDHDVEKPKTPQKEARRPTDPAIAAAYAALEAAQAAAKIAKQKRRDEAAKQKTTITKVIGALAKLAGDDHPAALAALKSLAKVALEKEASLNG
jgi:hypothetical protein